MFGVNKKKKAGPISACYGLCPPGVHGLESWSLVQQCLRGETSEVSGSASHAYSVFFALSPVGCRRKVPPDTEDQASILYPLSSVRCSVLATENGLRPPTAETWISVIMASYFFCVLVVKNVHRCFMTRPQV